jgi:hypothetical protein
MLISCHGYEKPKLEKANQVSLSGEYILGTNTLDVKAIEKGVVEIELCMSSENCAVPCYIGKLKKKKGSTIFSGKVHADLEGSENDIHPFKIKFNGTTASVSTTENWDLGLSCFVEGDYKKK